MGELLNMPLSDRFGFGKVSTGILTLFFPHNTQGNGYSSDGGGRVSLPNCSLCCPLSFPSFALSFVLGGIGMVFQVSDIDIYNELCDNLSNI